MPTMFNERILYLLSPGFHSGLAHEERLKWLV